MKTFRIAPDDMPSADEPRSLADILRWRAERSRDQRALTFLPDGETEAARLSFGELDLAARRVAAHLQQHGCRSKAVVLLFEPGPEFLIGFLSCLYAGAIGVPLYPPDVKRLSRTLPRFVAIAEDCEAEIILTTAAMRAIGSAVFEFAPQLARRAWLAVDEVPADLHQAWRDPGVSRDEVAFLQYTSGSTGNPKGVEVSHRSLLLNFSMLAHFVGSVSGESTVTWLPNYHDMGLIEGWLRPIYAGCHCAAMPPVAFLKRPLLWLKAITRYRAAVSGAPNFAYELCASKLADAEIEQLDLRSWRTAYCGAEPVREATLRRFTERFGRRGFRPEAFSPGYGLAEVGLVVSINDYRKPPVLFPIRKADLENRAAVAAPPVEGDAPGLPETQVAVGVGRPGLELLIVDPDTRRPLPRGRVGEIWVAGPSLARGYRRRPETNAEVFQARLASGEGPYLRTGDLGFQREQDDELFICGRHKDLIIIRGRNLYPQDVEQTVEASDPASLRPGCNAAFSVEVDGEERLVILQEVQRRFHDEASEWKSRRQPNPEIEAFAPALQGPPDLDQMIRSIREAVNESHGIDPIAVALLKAGSIPKTSSGKIQRRACRDGFMRGSLDVVKQWRAGATAHEPPAPHAAPREAAPAGPSASSAQASPPREDRRWAELRQWLRTNLASRLGLRPEAIDGARPFAQMGVDSREAVALAGDLEKELGTSLPASLLYDHPTVDQLLAHLQARSPAPTSEARSKAASNEPIAIIGIGCRLPGAGSPAELWKLLREGRDALAEVPSERWDREALYDPDAAAPGKMISRQGGFLLDADQFDPRAFDLTAREAARMDPQQRWLLEVTAEALESAGISPAACAGSPTGVFVGVSSFDWGRQLFQDRDGLDAYCGTGAALSIAANRISYQFDLHGPSAAVDTACSSSLVAVHLAIGSLRRGECTMAIAGGVNAVLSPEVSIVFTKAGVLAPEGGCKTFDARADGIARSEGAAVVVLKPLSKALSDGDPIWAVLKGSAVNSDGRSNGLMAPNGTAQQSVLRDAYRDAGVEAREVQYVEAHGTGTMLGDPIEVGAVASVLCSGRQPDRPCRIGSIKSNLGHLEAGAGIAGLIKVALSLHHRELVPSIHFREPNPHIAFERLGVRVQTACEPWPAPPGAGLAGVSAFGFGGTNAHVVLAEAPARAELRPPPDADRPVLVPLSARSAPGLRRLAEEFRRFLAGEGSGADLGRLAYTAARRRGHAGHRLSLVARTPEELDARLGEFLRGEGGAAPVLPEAERKLVFVFPGQGGQWAGMGRELCQREPAFRRAMEKLDRAFAPVLGWSLLDELGRGEESSRVHRTEFTHPLLFAVQAALCELMGTLGIVPGAVMGHSLGEVTAAYLAGKLELDEAARVLLHRGRIMATARGTGTMASVELTFDEASRLAGDYPGRLSVAVHNAPTSCVLAGDKAAIAEILERLKGRGVFARELRVEVAGHCPDMEPLMRPLEVAVGTVAPRAPRIPIVSTVTGASGDDLAFDGGYWARNLREPVRFQTAIEHLLARGYRSFLELSPHPVLQNPIAEVGAALGIEAHPFFTLRRSEGERESFLGAAGRLWAAGFDLDWERLCPGPYPALPMPTTPWDHERCRLGAALDRRRAPRGVHPLIADHVELPTEAGAHAFAVELDLGAHSWIGDHRVQDNAVFPAAGFLELVSAACGRAWGDWRCVLRDVRFERALILSESSARKVQTLFRPAAQGAQGAQGAQRDRWRFEIFSRASAEIEGAWTLHVAGELQRGAGRLEGERLDLAAIAARCAEREDPGSHYRNYLARGIDYRGSFQSVREVHRRDGEALGRVALSGEVGGFHVHPGLFDSCLQLMGSALARGGPGARETYMPVAIDRLAIVEAPGRAAASHAVLRPADPAAPDCHTADLALADERGELWGEIRGLRVRRVDSSEVAGAQVAEWLYQLEWEVAAPRGAAGADPGAEPSGRWLLFVDRSGVGAALAKELRARSRRVATASAGAAFRELEAERFELDGRDPSAMDRLLDRCAAAGPISRVVYLWGLDAAGSSGTSPLSPAVSDCAAVVHLVQSMARLGWREPSALWIVTRGAQSLPGSAAALEPVQSALWGLGRSLAQEHPELWGGLIDLDGGPDLRDVGAEAHSVLRELESPGVEDQLALRGADRLVPRLVHRPAASGGAPLVCAPDATYLVTGGLGALGLHLCRFLVERGARSLLVTGRSAFPRRADWTALAAKGDPRAALLLELERQGARAHYAVADAADESAMEKALALPGLPPLRGVLHAAGVVVGKPVLQTALDDVEAQMRPKVAGTWVLHQLTEQKKLDFFVVFSSASAIWGSKLLASYGAANHFMDELVQWRRSRGLPGLSVNWAMWGGGGMAEEGANGELLRRMGLRPMPPQKALAALEVLLAQGTGRAVVADVDWVVLKPLFEQVPRRRLLERVAVPRSEPGGAAAESRAARPGLVEALRAMPSPEARKLAVRDFVLAHVAEVLGLARERLDSGKSLLAQGMDSLNANDLRGRLQRALPVKVNVLFLLRGDSPLQLSDRVFEQLAETLDPSHEALSGHPHPAEAGPGRAPRATGPDAEVLPADIRSAGAKPMEDREPRAILLTGASGFLGCFTLAELLRRTRATVHCHVRAENDQAAMERICSRLKGARLWEPEMARRIVPLAGDLAQPRLGVPPARWETLAEEIDAVFHVGYAVNFLFSYDDLRPANVHSTVELLRLASSIRIKPLHFVSSFSVLLTQEHAGRAIGDGDRLYPAEGGYREGKRACERLIAEARRRGLPVSVYRPPFIGWHRATGTFNERDFLVRLLRGCLELRAAPELDAVFYIAPVDFVSSALVRLAADPEALNRSFNLLSSPTGISWKELVERVRDAGLPLCLEPFPAWRRRLAEAGPSHPLHAFFPAMDEGVAERGSAVLDLFQRAHAPASIDLSAMNERLGALARGMEIDEAYLRPFLERVAGISP